MNREYYKWLSPNLEREMEMLVFGHAGAKVLVFPSRGGRFYEYENLRIPQALSQKISNGELQLFCVDSIDSESFYCFWAAPQGRIQRYLQFEKYVLEEVLPFMEEHNSDPFVIAHGCSLGAFHAANIAFRHPELFRKLVAFSGRYSLCDPIEDFSDLFDGYYDEHVYFNTPTHFLPNLESPEILSNIRQMDIVMTIGEDDPFRENNETLSRILTEKGIDHRLHHWHERAHCGYYWRRMAPLYL
jgi:esterase/lipase superfamily enzyme